MSSRKTPVRQHREVFLVFALWAQKDGICRCPKGKKCPSPGKHPIKTGWQKDTRKASKEDLHELADPRARGGEGCNMGVRTGVEITPGFKLVVVDADSPEACSWIEGFGTSGTRTAVSGRGKHYYFSVPDHVEVHGATGIVPGVDVRGKGGLVVAPGSLHASGSRYRWESEGPVLPMPRTLLDEIVDHYNEREGEAKGVVEGLSRGRIASGEIRVGTRHDVLTRIAGSLRSRGYDKEGLPRIMGEINQGFCEVPVPSDEIRDIVKFALRMKPKRDAPVPDEDLELLAAMRKGYGALGYSRPFSISDKAIFLALVDAGMVNGVGGVGEVKVPIAYRVLAEKAGLSYKTVRRRIDALRELGFVKTGDNGGKSDDSGFIALQTRVVDPETGEILFDASRFLTFCPQDKREGEVIGPIAPIGTNGEHVANTSPPYLGDKLLRNAPPDLVLALRNGAGRLGKTSANALDAIIPLLSSSEEPLRPREIALALGADPKSPSYMVSLSRRLKKLREKGIVEKENGGYKLLPEAEVVIEDALKDSREVLKKQVEDHRKDRVMSRYSIALWKAERDEKELEDVPVPAGIRKSEGIKILERKRQSEKVPSPGHRGDDKDHALERGAG